MKLVTDAPSPHRCGKHHEMLSDVLESDGAISRVCGVCCSLREIDVVRGLHVRVAAERRVG
jgi:hypothetical protein